MQTFSNMRRSSTDYKPIVPYLLFVGAIIYESLSTFNIYFTPLLGVAFYYIITHIQSENHTKELVLIVLYSLYCEIERGLFPLSFLLFSIVLYRPIFSHLKKFITCQICEIVSYVVIFYIGYLLLNLFLTYIFNLELIMIDSRYIIYTISDILVLLVFL